MYLVLLKGHGHVVAVYFREPLNLVGMVKITCTLYAVQLEYQTVVFKID